MSLMLLLLKGKETKTTFECVHLIEKQRIMINVSVCSADRRQDMANLTDYKQIINVIRFKKQISGLQEHAHYFYINNT